LKIKNGYSVSEITKDFFFQIKQSPISSDFFLLSNTSISTEELFKIVTKLQSDRRVEFAEPNFLRELKFFTNDPFFNSQWAIKNQGYLGGIPGADMKVEQAWNFSTGTGIKVAIIDDGVDLAHPDLQSNLLAGFDATGNNSNGAPSGNDAHGTASAGIVAAVANNNIGISGVAYNAKILPVRIARRSSTNWTTDTWAASGINWAWQNGADVLSNSWGGGSYSSTIASAVTNAVTNGRNGKGSVVLFATGNNNGAVSFPATLDNVIAVGASSMCDQRKSTTSCDGESWWGGNFGSSLDVMAPGVKTYTTDIHGSAGYNAGDYLADFNGTSSACPNAAAVVALILSVNSNLTGQQARNVLESSCDKVGGYIYQSNIPGQPNGTWSNDAGYGRVNAQKAVCLAANQSLSISGSGFICTSETYSLNTNSSVTWSVSPSGLVNISPSGNQVTVTRVFDGPFTLSATVSAGCGVPVTRQLLSGTTSTPSTSIIGGIPNNYQFCIGSSFNVYSTISPLPVTNNWSVLGGTITAGQGTPHLNIQLDNTPGGYAIMVPYIDACGTQIIAQLQGQIVDNGCQGSNTQTSIYQRKLSIFPNPTADILNVLIEFTDDLEDYDYEIPNLKVFRNTDSDRIKKKFNSLKLGKTVSEFGGGVSFDTFVNVRP
jgi:subtilisin family serine protease